MTVDTFKIVPYVQIASFFRFKIDALMVNTVYSNSFSETVIHDSWHLQFTDDDIEQ